MIRLVQRGAGDRELARGPEEAFLVRACQHLRLELADGGLRRDRHAQDDLFVRLHDADYVSDLGHCGLYLVPQCKSPAFVTGPLDFAVSRCSENAEMLFFALEKLCSPQSFDKVACLYASEV